mmetsp:Transcript_20392/g.47889  ORF Transcript_20392/g.47889 Transcript_20392/m.47889 type:complete len:1238 (+) Transcript_20392:272-3985(+)
MRKQRPKYNPNGRTRRQRSVGSGENSNGSMNKSKHDQNGVRDPFRNGEIPLCLSLKEAIEDIFPELKNSQSSINGKRSQLPSSQAKTGSAFGQMVRRKFLRARKLLRTSLDENTIDGKLVEDPSFHEHSNGENNNGNIFINPPQPALTSAATKRRKRKKKKKRQDSSASLPPAIITNEIYSSNNQFDAVTYTPSRTGNGSLLSDGKSMMSTADHSLEALDEAVKIENEKMIEMEANHERPLLQSLPSDDNISAQESPSQFIDQIKPQEDTLLQLLPDHALELPLTDPAELTVMPSSLPADTTTANADASEDLWKTPLRLPFLVNAQSEESGKRNIEEDNQGTVSDGNASEGLRNLTTRMTDIERTRLLLHEWIDQSFFMNDKSQIAESSLTKDSAKEDAKHENDEWDSFIEFCNERTVGREKALGIPYGDLLNGGASIDCRFCREEALTEIKNTAIQDLDAGSADIRTKTSRLVMEPKILEKPSPQSDEDMNIEAAFDYVALEEGTHVMKKKWNEHEIENCDSNLSFLALDVSTDPKKRSTNKNDKKASAGNVATTEQHFFLETITTKQLEEFLYEWLIVGVDDNKLSQTSIRKATGESENEIGEAPLPVAISKDELNWVQKRVDETQGCNKNCFDTMIGKLEQIPSVPIEMNLDHDFTSMNTMENCEESCNEYFAEYILPILTRDFSVPSHACAELQIKIWAHYLEILGKTLNACNAYYKKLEEDVAEQNGTLPLFVLSRDFRSLYRQHSEEKIGYLSEIGKTFSIATVSLPMKEYHTRTFWKQCNPDKKSERSEKLDENCRNLIRSLTEWTRIVNGGRMRFINKERTNRLMHVFNMLRVVAESLGHEYETVKRHFSSERRRYFAWLLSKISLAHGVKSRMRLVEMDDVVGLTTGVILMWRHVRIMQSRVGTPTPAETLPLSLRRWILETPDSGAAVGGIESFVFRKCLPGSIGAKRRAMGILAGLTYAWLRERCEEWRAEIASKELLTDFDFEAAPSVADPHPAAGKKGGRPSGVAKPGKKAKKKRNRNKGSAAAAAANGSSPDPAIGPGVERAPPASSHDPVRSVPGEPKRRSEDEPIPDAEAASIPSAAPDPKAEATPVPDDEPNQTSMPDRTDEPETKDDRESEVPHDHDAVPVDHGRSPEGHALPDEDEGNPEQSSAAHEPSEADGEDLRESPVRGEENDDDDDDQDPFESRVAIQDETGRKIPPARFLADRLLALMGQPENDKILIIQDV